MGGTGTPLMNAPRDQRLQELVRQAAGLAGTERARFLDEQCAGDTALRADVEARLAAGEEDTLVLDSTPEVTAVVDALEPQDFVGQRVGPYRLLEVLGRGGMGSVFLGERADGEFRQKVAIKLVRTPWLSVSMLARFRTERQILARLQHPNIARLLDGGTTVQGQPYLVMEYVQGERIDRYCAGHNLSTRDRLRLFLDVCAAVAHAHRQLIIHRDLKPGNILVTGDGVVKLLDFGIARLLDTDDPEAEESPATVMHGLALTPEYASPEQIRGDPATTASDVYSLGVLLYELLTGTPLYHFQSTTLREVEKLVCETPVPRPSTAVSRNSLQSAAHGDRARLRQDIPLARLRRDLSGDLDTIVLTALAKEPEQRYRTVEQLAEDIRRHLEGYPLLARPPSLAYRLRKFVRRNAWAVASTAAVFLALLTGAGLAWMGMLQARAQAALAEARRQDLEQVARFQQSMLVGLDPQSMGAGLFARLRQQYGESLEQDVNATPGMEMARFGEALARINATDLARGLIDEFLLARAKASIERDFADRPQLQADLYDSVFQVYDSIGMAEPLLDLGDRILEARARGNALPAQMLSARLRQAEALVTGSRLQEGLAKLEEVIAAAEAAGLEHDPVYQEARSHLGQVLVDLGRIDEARALAEENLELARRSGEADRIVQALDSLGYIEARSQQIERALDYFREAADLVGEDHPDYLRVNTNLGAALGALRRTEEALAINARMYEVARTRLGERHLMTLRIANNVAANLVELDRLDEAVTRLQRLLALRSEILGENDPLTLRTMLNLGTAYARTDRVEEGLELMRTVARHRQTRLGRHHLDTLYAQEVLAAALNDHGRHGEAAFVARAAGEVALEHYGASHPRTLRLRYAELMALNGLGRARDAAALGETLLSDLGQGDGPPDERLRLGTAVELYVALVRQGQTRRAQALRLGPLRALLDATDPLDEWQQRQRQRVLSLPAGS